MGNYVNPRNTSFQKAVHSDIYIDKTGLISVINAKVNKINCFFCVSRPRRFGKSMAADMLAAYYSRGCSSRELFAGLEIEKDSSFLTHLNRHHVIRIDVQRFLETERDSDTFIAQIEQLVVEELLEQFPDCRGISPDSRLKTALNQIYKQKETGFIFIIDEWDCVFRFAKTRRQKQKEYLDFLRGLFKGAEYVELAYMTGILPIKKYGEHSALNIFTEYSMTDSKNLGQYYGFTEKEVQEQCRRHDMPYAEVKKWYDGYVLDGLHIYNPKSVVDVLAFREFQSYWTGTETYEALKVYIDRNFDGLKEAVAVMLGNGRCKINTRKFQNDMITFTAKDDILTLLVHLGYLAYDKASQEVFIPNQEVAGEFLNAADGPGWDGLAQALSQSEELLRCTWALDSDAVAKGIEAVHNKTASVIQYHNENSLACTVLIAYYSAKAYYLNPLMEFPSGKGFADIVYLPRPGADCPALIIELKWDKSAKGALEQIKNRSYAQWLEDYTGEILLAGINYHVKRKEHSCVIEKHVKSL